MTWNPPTLKPTTQNVAHEVQDFRDPSRIRYAQYRSYGWCFTAATEKLALQIRSRGRQDVVWREINTRRE